MSDSIRNHGRVVIAIDFDGTITEDRPFPERAEIRPEAFIYIPKLYREGFTLVLWTSRNALYYKEACERLQQCGLYRCFTNDYNLFTYGWNGKLEADYYIDDRMCSEINWEDIYRYIMKKEGRL